MSQPQVSVVMSVYNGLPYLIQAVEGILNQTFTDFEFIIIDDASNDQTWAVLTEYASNDPRIVLLRNSKNLGYTRSLINGISHSKAGYLARQDADDISHPERLAKQVQYMDQHPEVGLLGTLPKFIDHESRPLPISNYPLLVDDDSIQKQLIHSNCIHHGSVIYRRKLFDKVGGYDPSLEPSEDYDLWLRIGEVAKIANLPEPLYYYREHTSSQSMTRRFQQLSNKALALERALNRRFGFEPPKELLLVVANDYLRAAYTAFANKDMDAAHATLDRAYSFNPRLFDEGSMVEEVLSRYIMMCPSQERIGRIESVFIELLPYTPHLKNVRAQLLSNLHMTEVFEGWAENDYQRVDKHLWLGVRSNPRWLLNKGVLSLLGKRLLLHSVEKSEKRGETR